MFDLGTNCATESALFPYRLGKVVDESVNFEVYRKVCTPYVRSAVCWLEKNFG